MTSRDYPFPRRALMRNTSSTFNSPFSLTIALNSFSGSYSSSPSFSVAFSSLTLLIVSSVTRLPVRLKLKAEGFLRIRLSLISSSSCSSFYLYQHSNLVHHSAQSFGRRQQFPRKAVAQCFARRPPTASGLQLQVRANYELFFLRCYVHQQLAFRTAVQRNS